MKEKKMQIKTSESYGKKTVKDNVYLVEFDSIKDFLKYLDETPFNKVYQQEYYRHSLTGTKDFTGTENFEQAMSLLKNGLMADRYGYIQTHILKITIVKLCL